jgi:hypothetical protein
MKSFPRAIVLAIVLIGVSLSFGCYRATIKSGLAETAGAPATNSATHGGMIEGIVEDDPLHAGNVCKGPASSVYFETSFLNGLVNAVRGLFYYTQNVTVRCAAPPPEPGGPPPVIVDTSKYPAGSLVVVPPPATSAPATSAPTTSPPAPSDPR